MVALIQRVLHASVRVENECIARIEQGMLVFIGVEHNDNTVQAEKLAHKLLNYRIFADEAGRMNLSVQAIGGQVLLVPQFTLVANTTKGMRPGFSAAAEPKKGLELFTRLIDIMRRQAQQSTPPLAGEWLQSGQFGADMAVELLNDGPVSFYFRL